VECGHPYIERNQELDDSVKETVAMVLPIWERAQILTRAKNQICFILLFTGTE